MALVGLPVLWWLLRVSPPAPRRIAFPFVRLILGTRSEDETPERTPWWLLLLRMAIAGLLIVAAAGPILNPRAEAPLSGPLVLAIDDGWAAAQGWQARLELARAAVRRAARAGEPVAVLLTAAAKGAPEARFLPAREAERALAALEPKPWGTNRTAALAAVGALKPPGGKAGAVLWISDGLDAAGAAAFGRALSGLGPLSVYLPEAAASPVGLGRARLEPGTVDLAVRRSQDRTDERLGVSAVGPGGEIVGSASVTFARGEREQSVSIVVPVDAQARVVSVRIDGRASAGAVALIDETSRLKRVGIADFGNSAASGQPLLSAVHYLSEALADAAALRVAPIDALLKDPPALLFLEDRVALLPETREALTAYISAGGVLVRFAGPKLAQGEDDLVPAPLRRGGRAIGGALDWSEPQALQPFDAASPFAGLRIAEDIRVVRQVLADPVGEIGVETWARLADGTPLVTARREGHGLLVLFHVAATPGWSNLPLSGLFVGMLDRLVALAPGTVSPRAAPSPAMALPERGGQTLAPRLTLDAFGRLQGAFPGALPIVADRLDETRPGPEHPPGLYGPAGSPRALNLAPGLADLGAIEDLPSGAARLAPESAPAEPLAQDLLLAALLLLALDGLIALALSGRLVGSLRRAAPLLTLVLAALAAPEACAADAGANEVKALEASLEIRLAYVATGLRENDAISEAGLKGLSGDLARRTAIEPFPPVAIDLARDDLALYPFLYWRIVPEQPDLSQESLAKVDRYLRTGGTILFDTADHGLTTEDPASDARLQGPGARRLAEILAPLDLPPLSPVPDGHVLTRTFFLLDVFPERFPGRWNGSTLWIETPPTDEEAGTSLAGAAYDGVSPILIGDNDWASAWAVDDRGRYMAQVIPGSGRQREFAYRFGINLVMYTMTGNYKGDLVHVNEILKRLGQ
ncbi:MAG: DUF4159 domain-containing protein [Alphaproteobacteria bacterium]|nr:DUF4159 domain-containing protein [Alphaproteobacteria bacterium]